MSNVKPKLLGKRCEGTPKQRKYSLKNLKSLAKKYNLSMKNKKTYDEHCKTLRQYFKKNPIVIDKNLETSIRQFKSVDFFYLLSDKAPELEKYFKHFQDFHLTKEKVESIGEGSANGFVTRFTYKYKEIEIDGILKSLLDEYADSAIYEYLVGLCVNEFSKQFPFFPKTYALIQYKNRESYNKLEKAHKKPIHVNLEKMIRNYPSKSVEKLVVDGCKNSDMFGVVTQSVPVYGTLEKFMISLSIYNKRTLINEFNPKMESELTTFIGICYILYATLNSLKNSFTHYDLHDENILILKCPEDKYFEYKFHKPDGKTTTIRNRFYPIIIDLGRNWTSCQNRNSCLIPSDDIVRKVCNNDSIAKGRKGACEYYCGDERGYENVPDYNRKTKTFSKPGFDTRYQSLVSRNVSADLRPLEIIRDTLKFNRITNYPYVKKWRSLLESVIYKTRYGTPEVYKSGRNKSITYNVTDAYERLDEIVNMHDFIKKMNHCTKCKKYGTLTIHTDEKKKIPFTFSLA